jgi:hypothetical protein
MSTKSIKKSSITLEQYLKQRLPYWFEAEGQKLWMNTKPYVDTFITDTYGTAVGIINPDAPYKVVVKGMRRNAWYVNYITDEGMVYVIRNGGSDHQITF